MISSQLASGYGNDLVPPLYTALTDVGMYT